MPWQDMMLVISLLRGYVLVVMLILLKKNITGENCPYSVTATHTLC